MELVSKKIAITSLILFVILFSGYIFGIDYSVVEENYEAKGTVNSTADQNTTLGLVVEDNFDFGETINGTLVTKKLNISTSTLSKTLISSEGNISDNLDYPEKDYVEGGKRIDVGFNATEPGYYTGNISVEVHTPNNELTERWLELWNFIED